MDGVGVEFDHRGKLMREFKTLWAAVLERAILDLNKKITNRMSVTKRMKSMTLYVQLLFGLRMTKGILPVLFFGFAALWKWTLKIKGSNFL